jgi:hypothetical protein
MPGDCDIYATELLPDCALTITFAHGLVNSSSAIVNFDTAGQTSVEKEGIKAR